VAASVSVNSVAVITGIRSTGHGPSITTVVCASSSRLGTSPTTLHLARAAASISRDLVPIVALFRIHNNSITTKRSVALSPFVVVVTVTCCTSAVGSIANTKDTGIGAWSVLDLREIKIERSTASAAHNKLDGVLDTFFRGVVQKIDIDSGPAADGSCLGDSRDLCSADIDVEVGRSCCCFAIIENNVWGNLRVLRNENILGNTSF